MAFDWKTLDPETRARAVKSAILASVAIAALLAYFLRDPPPPVEAARSTSPAAEDVFPAPSTWRPEDFPRRVPRPALRPCEAPSHVA